MMSAIFITLAVSLVAPRGSAAADTVVTRMATHSPADFQHIVDSIDLSIVSPIDSSLQILLPQFGLTHMPVPPSEFGAAVAATRGVSGSTIQLASIRDDLKESLKSDNWKKTCDGAAWHLLAFLRILKDKSIDDWNALRWGNPDLIRGYKSRTPEDIKSDFRVIMDVYDDKCLESPDLSSLNRHERATGVLLDQDVPYCTATRVSPFHILTARHCLFRHGDQQRIAIASFLSAPDRTWELHRLNGDTDPWTIGDLVRTGDRYFYNYGTSDPLDFEILELHRETFTDSAISFYSGDVRTGDPVRILAHNNYVRAYLHIVNGRAPSWQHAMRFDTQISCRAELFDYEDPELEQACVIHGCQTAPSSSGAAVLYAGSAVGVHINENYAQGCASALKYVGNRGVRKWKVFDQIVSAVLDDESRHLQ